MRSPVPTPAHAASPQALPHATASRLNGTALPRLRTAARSFVRTLLHPDVRALAALVASPSLIAAGDSPVALLDDDWRLATLMAQRGWLAALDAAPAALVAHLAQSNARQLGRYAEALWQFWFARLPGAKVHAAGLPVKDGAAVRGEFDFIVALPGLPGVQHLETGYKFYLCNAAGNGDAECVGPDPADRLDRKWRHMIGAQLALAQTSHGRAALPSMLAAGPITPRACLQGYIFYPLGAAPTPSPALAPEHARGWWTRFDGGEHPAWTRLARAYAVLPKLRWIAPAIVGPDDPPPMSARDCQAQLVHHFAASRQAQLLAGVVRASDGRWHETVRLFVVHPNWPGA